MPKNDGVIAFAQGVGMLLVVMGHSFPPEGFIENSYSLIFLKKFIYSFHMPLFACISGYLFFKYDNTSNYLFFLRKKFNRLIIPYVFFIIFVTTIKCILSSFAQNPIVFSFQVVVNNLIFPWDAPTSVYWFLVVLFIIFLLFPILKKIS